MAPKLYGHIRSPGVRAVLLAAKALNIEVEFIEIDLGKNEHLTEEYIKMNPRHSIPTLDDDGEIIWDSHAIMIYLAEKYGNNSPLYPTDLKKRAAINRMLFFECGEVFSMHLYICNEVLLNGAKEVPKGPAEREVKALTFLETFLKNSKFVAGDEMTIADFSLWTTLLNASLFVPIDNKKFPKITEWLNRLNELPYKNINEEGAVVFKKKVDIILGR